MRELGIAYLVLLLLFFLAGSTFMKVLSLDVAAVNIAGGVVLFLIALRMVFPTPEGLFENTGLQGEPLMSRLPCLLLRGQAH